MDQFSINPSYLPILGSIAAAVVSGTIAFLIAVFTKENKISEFRQAWIDALRSDVAEFLSMYHVIATTFEVARKELEVGKKLSQAEIFQSVRSEIIRIEQSSSRIELRLNPSEHREVIRKINELKAMDKYISYSQRSPALDSLQSDFHDILKSEWRRVKRGEPIYRVVKWVSFFIACAAVCFIFILRLI